MPKKHLLLDIAVFSNGERIGTMTATEFMRYCNRPGQFLKKLVDDFNTQKERIGEPERVQIFLSST